MESKFGILILDRNRYIRIFLERELGQKGYRVIQVNDTSELASLCSNKAGYDLIVLDPELLDSSGEPIIEYIRLCFPNIPIVLHTLWQDKSKYAIDSTVIACVEKDGNSIVAIHQIILDIFGKSEQSQIESVGPIFDCAKN